MRATPARLSARRLRSFSCCERATRAGLPSRTGTCVTPGRYSCLVPVWPAAPLLASRPRGYSRRTRGDTPKAARVAPVWVPASRLCGYRPRACVGTGLAPVWVPASRLCGYRPRACVGTRDHDPQRALVPSSHGYLCRACMATVAPAQPTVSRPSALLAAQLHASRQRGHLRYYAPSSRGFPRCARAVSALRPRGCPSRVGTPIRVGRPPPLLTVSPSLPPTRPPRARRTSLCPCDPGGETITSPPGEARGSRCPMQR
ncbi:hypothetical protein CryarDRAFT_0379 [Cryptosporangium arvum DSM 44712]|uniref:Uncharacterized protein n=1 Tax=Cryptosporangium arvum DSM 44712 TaxID=927661 RepID=A0A010ZL27_9ACTN|nr:hypothetical protein CryarDRAFT_0379 [Cryptosporangium arvum DSM 44712]